MGDGGAERGRGPARRESRGGRGADRRAAEESRADAGGRSPGEVAGTSASSPAGSRESGADSDGQPGLGETDHCRRILVRGKGSLPSLPWTPGPPTLPQPGSPTFPQAPPPSQYITSISHHSAIHSVNIILSAYCVLDTDVSAEDKAATGPERPPLRWGTFAAAGAGPWPRAPPAGGGGSRRRGGRVRLRGPRGGRGKASGSLAGSGRGDQSQEPPRGGKARAPLCGRELLRLQRSPVSPGRRRAARGGRGARGRARRPPARRCFALASNFLAAPGPSRLSARPSFRSAFRVSPLLPPSFSAGRFSPPSSPSQLSPASASGLRPSTRLSPGSPPRERGWSDHRTPVLPASQSHAKPLAQLSPELASP